MKKNLIVIAIVGILAITLTGCASTQSLTDRTQRPAGWLSASRDLVWDLADQTRASYTPLEARVAQSEALAVTEAKKREATDKAQEARLEALEMAEAERARAEAEALSQTRAQAASGAKSLDERVGELETGAQATGDRVSALEERADKTDARLEALEKEVNRLCGMVTARTEAEGLTPEALVALQIASFDTASFELTDKQRRNLAVIIKAAKGGRLRILRVEGFADPRGSFGYNAGLGLQRAAAVGTAMKEAGLPYPEVLSGGEQDAFSSQRSARTCLIYVQLVDPTAAKSLVPRRSDPAPRVTAPKPRPRPRPRPQPRKAEPAKKAEPAPPAPPAVQPATRGATPPPVVAPPAVVPSTPGVGSGGAPTP